MMIFAANQRSQSLIVLLLILLAFGSCLTEVEPTKANDEIPITPNDEFFEVAIDFWDIDPEDYRLVVKGEVNNPLNLSLAEIKALPVTSEIVRLTCIEYTFGASDRTGVANWTGVKLSVILDLAEIDMEKAVDVSFHTPDLSLSGYSTSLNLEQAYWDDVILAYEMNEESLPKVHGFPLRLVCPRLFGYKWIKWVTSIDVTPYDYRGFWEVRGYADTPYVSIIDLPVYYPLTSESGTAASDSETPQTKEQRSFGFSFHLFFAALATLTLSRLRKKRNKKEGVFLAKK
jgi:DMSO/TMAO reductase YedYZ molybdopterin-dependent catalytic subunit